MDEVGSQASAKFVNFISRLFDIMAARFKIKSTIL